MPKKLERPARQGRGTFNPRSPVIHGHGGLDDFPLVWCGAPNPATSQHGWDQSRLEYFTDTTLPACESRICGPLVQQSPPWPGLQGHGTLING